MECLCCFCARSGWDQDGVELCNRTPLPIEVRACPDYIPEDYQMRELFSLSGKKWNSNCPDPQ